MCIVSTNTCAPAAAALAARVAAPAAATPTFAMVAPPKRIDASAEDARFTAQSLLGRTGAETKRSCTVHGGALHVLSDAGLQVAEADGVILALASEVLTAEEVLAAYTATSSASPAICGSDHDTRRRVNALKAALGDMHASKGAFAMVMYDAAVGRVLAARTANSTLLSYGFTADGTLVACAGLTSEALFPECGASALELTPLPSGRFIFGHRYVKPIEFTLFWGTAAANRSAAPARKACDYPGASSAASVACVAIEAAVELLETAAAADMSSAASFAAAEQRKAARRWGATGSVADNTGNWKRGNDAADDVENSEVSKASSPAPRNYTRFAPSTSAAAAASADSNINALPVFSMAPKAGSYMPPAMRARAAAAAAAAVVEKAAAAVAATAAAAAAATAAAEAAAEGVALVSPRTSARNFAADAQVAAALASEDHIVTSLENALASAMSAINAESSNTTAAATSDWQMVRIPLSLRIPEDDLATTACAPAHRGAMTLEGSSRRGGNSRGNSRSGSIDGQRNQWSSALDTATLERALASAGAGAVGSDAERVRRSMEVARRSMDVCSRSSFDALALSRRGSMDIRSSLDLVVPL